MGTILAEQRRYEEALKHFETVIGADPANAASYYNKGLCFQEQRKYVEAVSCYKKVWCNKRELRIGHREGTIFY